MEFVEVTLVLPEGRRECVSWLRQQPPDTLATLLDGLNRMGQSVATPDVERLRKEHDEVVSSLKAEHSSTVAVLEGIIESSKEWHMSRLQEVIRDEVARQLPPPIPEDDREENAAPPLSATTTILSMSINEYYKAKKRLPRNLGDLVRTLSGEDMTHVLSNPGLFETIVADVKRAHYKKCGGKGRKRSRRIESSEE